MNIKPYGYANAFKHRRNHYMRAGTVCRSISVCQSHVLYELCDGYASKEEAESEWEWVGTFELKIHYAKPLN